MHAYRNDVRLRLSLEAVMDGEQDLSQIALDAGFSSHSHFTSAFRAHFGLTPSGARDARCGMRDAVAFSWSRTRAQERRPDDDHDRERYYKKRKSFRTELFD